MEKEKTFISLTSYAPRFPNLSITLESILDQASLVDGVTLWIFHEEIKTLKKYLSSNLSKYIEINACSQLYSYKKILPLMARNSSINIITADDDTTYPDGWLQSLLDWHFEHPREVVAHRVHHIKTTTDGDLLPYNQWVRCIKEPCVPSPLNFQTGLGGVFYPAGVLSTEVFNVKRILRICPFADDIWLYFMARINGRYIVPTGIDIDLSPHPGSQSVALWKKNIGENGNDIVLKQLAGIYGRVWLDELKRKEGRNGVD